MTSRSSLKAFITLYINFNVLLPCLADQYMNPDWVDPHAWSKERDPLIQLCPESQPCKPCESNAQAPYLRLVNTIFDINKLHFDESTSYLHRTIHIHITEEQLQKLRETKDVNRIDGLVAEVLAQTNFGTTQLVKEFAVDMASVLLQRFDKLSDSIFSALPRSRVLYNFIAFVIVFLMCRRHNVNFVLVLIFTSIFFIYEYLDHECHKRIELNEALEFMYSKQKSACMNQANRSWYDWLLGSDSRKECRDFLEKHSRKAQEQCGVVDLFHEFTVHILLKQLKYFFTTIAEMVQSITATYGILVAAITLYFMKDLLGTIIFSTFKFLVNPTIWSRVAVDINQASQPTPAPTTNQNATETSRMQAIQEPDIRDLNISKALDLLKLTLPTPQTNEYLPLTEKAVENFARIVDLTAIPTESSDSSQMLRSPEGSDCIESYVEVTQEDIANASLEETVSVKSSQNDLIELSSCGSSSSDKSDKSNRSSISQASTDTKLSSDIEIVPNSLDSSISESHSCST